MSHTDHSPDVGQPSGLASLDAAGKIPMSQTDVGTTVGKLVQLVDVGGGAAGFPPVDGSLLLNVGAAFHPVHTAAVDPTVDDDSSHSYLVGHHWINTNAVPPRAFQATGVAVGAAIWKRLSNLKNNVAAVPPTANDDGTQDYEIGSFWYDTVLQVFYVCTDATASAAVWRLIHPVRSTTSDPTVNDDSTAGFAPGHHWVNTAATPPRVFQCLTAAAGAAVWGRVSNLKCMSAITDPLTSNDITQGYELGSCWTNTADDTIFACVHNAAGAAIWKEISNVPGAGKQTPKEHFLEPLLAYGAVGAHPLGASTIQYTRVWLTAGLEIDYIRVFIDSGGLASRYIRMGLYDQVDPLSTSGVPNTRVATTARVGTEVEEYIDAPLSSTYTVTITGYYWIAFVTDTVSVKFSITETVYRADFAPRRAETTTGTTLPATASGLTNPAGGIAYVSALEP